MTSFTTVIPVSLPAVCRQVRTINSALTICHNHLSLQLVVDFILPRYRVSAQNVFISDFIWSSSLCTSRLMCTPFTVHDAPQSPAAPACFLKSSSQPSLRLTAACLSLKYVHVVQSRSDSGWKNWMFHITDEKTADLISNIENYLTLTACM